MLYALKQTGEKVSSKDLTAQQSITDDCSIGTEVFLEDGEKNGPFHQFPLHLYLAGRDGAATFSGSDHGGESRQAPDLQEIHHFPQCRPGSAIAIELTLI